jgi:N-acetylmuramoyl-L-alanine amidase
VVCRLAVCAGGVLRSHASRRTCFARVDSGAVATFSRRTFFRGLIGSAGALSALRHGSRVSLAEGGAHEDLVDDAEGFAKGDFETCWLEQGRVVADGVARFTSRELVANGPFTHAGLHWESEGGGDSLTCAFRSRTLHGSWSEWRRVLVERTADECPTPGAFGMLAFTGPGSQAAQYRVDFRGGSTGLNRVVASVLSVPPMPLAGSPVMLAQRGDAALSAPHPVRSRIFLGEVARDRSVVGGDATHAADPSHERLLEVVPREAWGADEALRFDADGNELWHEMFVPVRALVVHHAGTRNGYDSPEDAAADVRAIYYYHAVIEGWHDLGYNALIDRFGNIYEGRHGRGGDPGDSSGREVLSEGVSAGHVHKHNYGSAGVVLLGDSTEEGWPLVASEGAMWEALTRYCSFEAARAGLRLVDPSDPGAPMTSAFLRSDNVWHADIPNLGGHRDSEETLCPGDVVLDLLPDLRAAVEASFSGMSRSGVSLARVSPAEREVLPGTRISYHWSAELPEAGWEVAGFQCAVEAWFKPDDGDDLTYLGGYTVEPQPRLAWTDVSPGHQELSFLAQQPGQYTTHVRALLSGPEGFAPAAFEAHDSVLVREAPTIP